MKLLNNIFRLSINLILKFLGLSLILFSGCRYFIDMDYINNYHCGARDPWRKVVIRKFEDKLKNDKELFDENIENVKFWFSDSTKETNTGIEISKSNVAAMDWLSTGFNTDRIGNYLFKKHFVYVIGQNYGYDVVPLDTGEGTWDPNCSAYLFVSVGTDSQIHCLWQLESFNEMTKEESLDLNSPSDIISLLDAFLYLYNPRFNIIILKSVDDIPNDQVTSEKTKFKKLKETISFPQITKGEYGYVVRVFSWTPLYGIVAGWEIEISTKGIITVLAKKKIADRIGKFKRVCFLYSIKKL